jgi:glutamyl-tRNA(Gln) amidotransferase subunit D
MKNFEFYKKNSIKEGNLIEFDFEGNKIQGTIIPSNNQEEIIMLKLASGYNAGFLTTKIKNVKSLGEAKQVGKAKTITIKKNPNLPNISILHTGGTIASRVNYSVGGVIASFDLQDLITMFPELGNIANIDSVFVANMMSEDMQTMHFEKISQTVNEQIKKGVKGIIIGHGTDMLGYSAAALAFELENCPIPVLIVGNKIDLKKADIKKIEAAFPEYDVVGISTKEGKNFEEFYESIFKLVKKV